jgi:hypothetical protein
MGLFSVEVSTLLLRTFCKYKFDGIRSWVFPLDGQACSFSNSGGSTSSGGAFSQPTTVLLLVSSSCCNSSVSTLSSILFEDASYLCASCVSCMAARISTAPVLKSQSAWRPDERFRTIVLLLWCFFQAPAIWLSYLLMLSSTPLSSSMAELCIYFDSLFRCSQVRARCSQVRDRGQTLSASGG